MDQIKGLKYALVLVLVTSIALFTFTTYMQRRFENKVAAFYNSMGQVKSEAEAKELIRNFMTDVKKDPVAQSASADDFPCDWLCVNGATPSTTRTVPMR